MRPRRVFLAAALGALVLQSLRLYGAFDVLQFVLAHSAGPWGPVLFVPAYAASCILCLPGSVLTFGAGAVFGFEKGAALVLAGANLGALAAFFLSRHLLYGLVHKRVQKNRKLRALDR
ncbi:MAG: VTT domain-containing protein, partial [Elusimicrobia bacterium]|nr:VTT domain-containing protein [Elusimicrobiota bacterium]